MSFSPERAEDKSWSEGLRILLQDLRNKPDESGRLKATKNFRIFVNAKTRELTGEAKLQFMKDVNVGLLDLSNGPLADKITMLNVVDDLIDLEFVEETVKRNSYASYIRQHLKSCSSQSDLQVVSLSAKVFGHIARACGHLGLELIEPQFEVCLNYIKTERHMVAGILILKELAQNVPTRFYLHLAVFLDNVWNAFKDSRPQVREAAAETLKISLTIVSEREGKRDYDWAGDVKLNYYFSKLLEDAQNGLRSNDVSVVHGALLALSEIVFQTSAHSLQDKYTDLCEAVYNLKENKDKSIRRAVISIFPRLASNNKAVFSNKFLRNVMGYLLGLLNRGKDSEWGPPFLAIGELARVLESDIKEYVDQIATKIKESLTREKGKKNFCPEALTCVAMMCVALGVSSSAFLGKREDSSSILNLLFHGGLSSSLVDALTEILAHVPSALPAVQEKLLEMFSGILVKTHHLHTEGSTASLRRVSSTTINVQDSEPSIILALKTVGSFKFASSSVHELMREQIVPFLDDDNPSIRKEAAVTCCKLIKRIQDEETKTYSPIVAELLEKLMIVGIADLDPSIRHTILSNLDPDFDAYLAQAENLRSLFIALNDEVFENREIAIAVIGRLSIRNPAFVMPSLRKTLVQLLTELEFSGDSRNKEECAKLLYHLISASGKIIKPYAEPVLSSMMPKLKSGNHLLTTYLLAALGEISLVAGEVINDYLDQLLSIILDMISDQSTPASRDVAFCTLIQLARSTGNAISIYKKYPQLLGMLLNEIKTEQNKSLRRTVIRVVSYLGALDPYLHKLHLLHLEKGSEEKKLDSQDFISALTPSSDDYHAAVVITELMKVLRDPSLDNVTIVTPVMLTIKTLGRQKCSKFLPLIIPTFIFLLRNSDQTQYREVLFSQLGSLVSIVKHEILGYLDEIFEIIEESWGTSLFMKIMMLVEEMSRALNEDFKTYLSRLIPLMLNVIHTDRSSSRQPTAVVLNALEIFGGSLDDYLHLVVPALVTLIEQVDAPVNIRTRAMQCLRTLCNRNFSEFASKIIHPLSRVLENPELQKETMETLCSLMYNISSDFAIFVPMLNKVLSKNKIQHTKYETFVSRLLKNQTLIDTPEGEGQSSKSNDYSDTSTESNTKKTINEAALKKTWDELPSKQSSKDEWQEWLRRLSVELIKESPSPLLRGCCNITQSYESLAHDLFNVTFLSCWNVLSEEAAENWSRSLELALGSSNIPPEILQSLLNLVEFMEHGEKNLDIDIKTLGSLAENTQAFAKALHYKELEFHLSKDNSPPRVVISILEALVSIYYKLQQPEAAIGILNYAQKKHSFELKESWYEKLQRWEDALNLYEQKGSNSQTLLGKIRCLHALGEWERLMEQTQFCWPKANEEMKKTIAPAAAAAAWNLCRWDALVNYTAYIDTNTVEGLFLRAVLFVHGGKFGEAQQFIDKTRDILEPECVALVGESYNRAYSTFVRLQQLAELEEIIEYKSADDLRRQTICKLWRDRLRGCQRTVEVWQQILAVRSLVLQPHEDRESWIKFSHLCRKSGRTRQAHKILTNLLGKDPTQNPNDPLPLSIPIVAYSYIKHEWESGQTHRALSHLVQFANSNQNDPHLQAHCYLKLGQWSLALQEVLDERSIYKILAYFEKSTLYDNNLYKAWHAFALMNFEVISFYEKKRDSQVKNYFSPAIQAFFRSIALRPSQSLQDTLRLLRIWFKYGSHKEVEASLLEGFNTVGVDTWLQVVPQIIARIQSASAPVRRLIHELLSAVGKAHPQALVYPLTMAAKSQASVTAESLMEGMRSHSRALCEQALMVSQELIRVSILWLEMWHEAIEEAWKLHSQEKNTIASIENLAPLHEMMKSPETLREIAFQQTFGRDLAEAREWSEKYLRSNQIGDLNQAWDLYSQVFRMITKQIPMFKTIEMKYVSSALLNSHNLDLAIPGTYQTGQDIVKISSFSPKLVVMVSKQRPRKFSIMGSDGIEYNFLLKGHEDLRQDERVMQLFGLVNTILAHDRETSKFHLSITRYAVIPLSPNSGLIGWVPNCDTLHSLIRDFRSKSGMLNQEHKLMLQMSPDYDRLPLVQKVEIFSHAMQQSTGQDINKVLWLKSSNSEVWLDRRTNYTRSLSVMSMVGYILGLGDRHPNNLMLERHMGKIIHIDFGDCFEVAMMREKLPEKIPFRLTRMMINAMDVSGIDGAFRFTCENVMRCLRENKDSLMAVLEAFVYDPLINWRLLPSADPKGGGGGQQQSQHSAKIEEDKPTSQSAAVPLSLAGSAVKFDLDSEKPEEGDDHEVFNERAVAVISRVSKKLTGKDFSDATLDVSAQVGKLIEQATSYENLCQCYIGWCPFW